MNACGYVTTYEAQKEKKPSCDGNLKHTGCDIGAGKSDLLSRRTKFNLCMAIRFSCGAGRKQLSRRVENQPCISVYVHTCVHNVP